MGDQDQSFGQKLKSETTGCRLEIGGISCRRSMAKDSLKRVAELFSADQRSVSGSRAIIDRKHSLIQPVLALQSAAKALVEASTIDYPEKGVRLVKVARVAWINDEIGKIREQLESAVSDLADHWDEIKADAQERLADLYREDDYPSTPVGCWSIDISFPAIEPDKRLMQLHPELYEAEQRRIAAKFDAAVADAESAMAAEFGTLVGNLIDRLGSGDDGKPKMIRESAVGNLRDFAARFRELSIGSNEELDGLVAQVERLVDGVDVKKLRKDVHARDELREAIRSRAEVLDSLVVARPTRAFNLEDTE